jgi:hypothetical protein
MKMVHKWHKWILAVFAACALTSCASIPNDTAIFYVTPDGELVPSVGNNGAIIYGTEPFAAELGASSGAMSNNHRKDQKEKQEKYDENGS